MRLYKDKLERIYVNKFFLDYKANQECDELFICLDIKKYEDWYKLNMTSLLRKIKQRIQTAMNKSVNVDFFIDLDGGIGEDHQAHFIYFYETSKKN